MEAVSNACEILVVLSETDSCCDVDVAGRKILKNDLNEIG
jgi:hypothetical protein